MMSPRCSIAGVRKQNSQHTFRKSGAQEAPPGSSMASSASSIHSDGTEVLELTGLVVLRCVMSVGHTDRTLFLERLRRGVVGGHGAEPLAQCLQPTLLGVGGGIPVKHRIARPLQTSASEVAGNVGVTADATTDANAEPQKFARMGCPEAHGSRCRQGQSSMGQRNNNSICRCAAETR